MAQASITEGWEKKMAWARREYSDVFCSLSLLKALAEVDFVPVTEQSPVTLGRNLLTMPLRIGEHVKEIE